MARIKIDLPSRFGFAATIPVRITDLNYGGHVGNDALLSMLHEARMQYLQHLGFTELEVAGTSLIMADVAISYLGESFYGDVLQVQVAAADIHRHGFDLFYRVTSQAGKEIANAKTGMLCFDYSTRKLALLPLSAKTAFEGSGSGN